MKFLRWSAMKVLAVASIALVVVGCSHVPAIRTVDVARTNRRAVLPPAEVDAWIAFLGARYRGETAPVPNDLITLNDIFSVPHFTGVPVIFPSTDETFYNMQVDVWRDNRTYRYNFSFTAKKGADLDIATAKDFFA
ncbi:MAG: hypothetical protein JWM35_859, partial [Verrucomicrobia bacterium]|nr:hypothetical protein [Verrucomicrobiota bacterium]